MVTEIRVLYILDESSKETKFLSRNEGEIYRAIGCVENEKEIIRNTGLQLRSPVLFIQK